MASRARKSRLKTYAYLVGHGLLILGFLFFTVGFATDHWLHTADFRYGLWELCNGDGCDATSSGFAAWMLATRAMQTMSLMCYMAGVLVALFLHCVTHTAAPCHSLYGKDCVLDIFTAIGNVLCLIGVSVYGAKGDNWGRLGYSYVLTVFSLFLTTPGVVIITLTRSAATANAGVAPQPAQADTTTRQNSGAGGREYPYGRGQHSAQNDDPNRRDDNPFPFGRRPPRSPTLSPPSAARQPLPYPLHPDGPAGGPGSLSMPEPTPVGGGHGGTGLYRAQSRLPPLTEVSPSAPPPPPLSPPPPPDGLDQPPSYLEAIGHSRP